MIDRFMAWLDKVLPWQCAVCKGWYTGRYYTMTTTWGSTVRVCKECYRDVNGI